MKTNKPFFTRVFDLIEKARRLHRASKVKSRLGKGYTPHRRKRVSGRKRT